MRKMSKRRLSTAVCCWAAILLWIRLDGAIAFVQQTPSVAADGASLRVLLYQSTPLNAWLQADDGLGVVTNWDSDHQDESELMSQQWKTRRSKSGARTSSSSSSSDERQEQTTKNETIIHMRKRDKPHRRRRGFRMPSGSGATSDGVRFSVPSIDTEPEHDTVSATEKPDKTQPINSGWYLTLDKSTGLQVPLNMTLGTNESSSMDKTIIARQRAELSFRVRASLLEDDEGTTDHIGTNKQKVSRRKKKIRQLASLLNVSIASARTMIRRVPSLESMDIAGTLARRCVDMTLILKCTPSKFSSIVRHCPTLLTYRSDTIATKLVQLDRLFLGQTPYTANSDESFETPSNGTEILSPNDAIIRPAPPLCGNQTTRLDVQVSESTMSIARRVPQLLVSNVPGTLAKRVVSLRSLLFTTSYDSDDDFQSFNRILKRCPELLLYNEATIAPKLLELDALLVQPGNKVFLRQQLGPCMSRRSIGIDLALKEPRLLLYDIDNSLALKAREWRDRVNDSHAFTVLLAKYPTLFMYSLGASLRLEYFEYRNKRKPDASEARQLLMLSKKAVEAWGTEGNDCLFDSTPAILGGTISKRGRPRDGESAVDASKRRGDRRAAQISELHSNGCFTTSKKSGALENKRSNDIQPLLSYCQWISMKLSTSHPQLLERNEGNSSKHLSGEAGNQTAGELEKLYGMALKRSTVAMASAVETS